MRRLSFPAVVSPSYVNQYRLVKESMWRIFSKLVLVRMARMHSVSVVGKYFAVSWTTCSCETMGVSRASVM